MSENKLTVITTCLRSGTPCGCTGTTGLATLCQSQRQYGAIGYTKPPFVMEPGYVYYRPTTKGQAPTETPILGEVLYWHRGESRWDTCAGNRASWCTSDWYRYPEQAAPIVDNEAYTGNAVSLPEDDASRASMPLADGCLDYFPNALAYVAFISKKGSDKHNPGQEMHWARDKSTDHANKMMRHLIDRGRMDQDGIRHSGNLAWRALANLQNELEEAGLCPRSRASK